ncbi:MAG TPA: type II secretion system F family protein [Tissierellaceae bacterium]
MTYKYRAVSKNGDIVEGVYEGKDELDVLNMLKQNNYLPISVEKHATTISKRDLFSPSVKKKDLALFCRQFYAMLKAGIGIIRCLEILEKQVENKTMAKAISKVIEDVQKGFTLSEAMGVHKNVFPQLLLNMVKAGEVSGNLDTIMERMAIQYEKEYKIEQKVKSALIYPVLLAFITLLVVIFLLIHVIPNFVVFFEENGYTLPLPTIILLNISRLLNEYWHLIVLIIIGFSLIIIVYKNTSNGRTLIDSAKLKIPYIKDINIKIIVTRFTRTLSTLLSSGIPLIQSIEVVSNIIGNSVVYSRLQTVKDNVKKGITLSKAIRDIKIFPPLVDSMIYVGEESGALDDILLKTADFYDDEVENSLLRITSLLEPILLIIMAIIIGFIVVSVVLPMFEMVDILQ